MISPSMLPPCLLILKITRLPLALGDGGGRAERVGERLGEGVAQRVHHEGAERARVAHAGLVLGGADDEVLGVADDLGAHLEEAAERELGDLDGVATRIILEHSFTPTKMLTRSSGDTRTGRTTANGDTREGGGSR